MWQGCHTFTDPGGGGGGGVTCVLQPPCCAHTHAQASLMPFMVCNCILLLFVCFGDTLVGCFATNRKHNDQIWDRHVQVM